MKQPSAEDGPGAQRAPAGARNGAGAGTGASGGQGVVLDGVSLSFDRGRRGGMVQALRDLSLSAAPSTFTVLLGPSGCGKTTVLRLVDGLIRPSTGRVEVFGKTPRPGPDIGLVFQSFRLIPWATTRANVEFGLRETGLSAAERRERAEDWLELVGLSRFAEAYPRELSGGMKQRAAIARAMAPDPSVLLLDEPFASIDAQARELMQIELIRIWNDRRPLVMFVTHSVDEALLLADRIALFGPSPGRVVEVVDVDLDRPRWHQETYAEPRYIELRRYLTDRLRDFVFNDPTSDFYGRDPRALDR